MYVDITTDEEDFIVRLFQECIQEEEPVQMTVNKRGSLFRLTIVQADELATS